jgi:hypothetical protein
VFCCYCYTSYNATRRYSLSGLPCVLPYVAAGSSQWDCLSVPTNANTTTTTGLTTSNSSSGNAGTAAAAVAAVVARLVSGLGVCPLSSGQWGVCAPQTTPPGQSR